MFHRWAALVLVLALCAMSPKNAAGQTQSTQPRGTSGGIRTAYPNPFNPDISVQFFVGDTTNNCASDRQTHVVNLEIRNVLGQRQAIPILQGPSSSGSSTSMNGAPITGLHIECGSYTAYWNGNVLNTGREAPSGMYFVILTVDNGKPTIFRIYNKK